MNATIEDIIKNPDYNKLFKEEYFKQFVARPADKENPKEETLINHSKTTLEIFDTLVEELRLKSVFEELFRKSFGNYDPKFWNILRAIVYYHDFGKMNQEYQERIKEITKKNCGEICDERKLNKSKESEHALPGLFLFGLMLEKYLKNEDEKIKAVFFYLASVIARHHTNLKSPVEIGESMDTLWEKPKESTFKKLIKKIQEDLKNNGQIENLAVWFDQRNNLPIEKAGFIFRYFHDTINSYKPEQQEALFYLHKLLYSCLVSADYYAAYHRETPEEIANTLSDIKKLKDNLNAHLSSKKSDDDVSKAREKFRITALERLHNKDNEKKNVFYLYLPTGGGKTLTSLNLALELAEKNHSNRLFYVFPFVNIIEQNQKALKEALKDENLISPIYSYSDWKKIDDEDDDTHFINQEFTNYPVVVLSNVNFFNALIKSGKSSNYKLHNFANSVIVIDEIQSLNAKEWTLYNDLIVNAAEMLNSKIIVMSASIPPIYELSEDEEKERIQTEVGILIEPDEEKLRGDFKLFLDRTELLLEEKDTELHKLTIEKIKSHEFPNKVLIVANTIKKSLETYKKLKKDKELKEQYGSKILLLNSTLLPSRRKELVRLIGNENERLILVSTQSVEAGLDVDFDLGIRELAPLDNLLQICGRVNRHGKKNNKCVVYVATGGVEKDSIVYGDLRFSGGKDKQKKNKQKTENKNMQVYIKKLLGEDTKIDEKYAEYSKEIVELIKKQNKDVYRESQRHAVESLRNMDFDSLNEHNVIEQQSVSIFIPANVPLDPKDDEQ
ncbi:hypothetical protein A2335_04620, partial [Candidatus Peregrinibacteria bacterium RIFOXYB2_FULL_32_7]